MNGLKFGGWESIGKLGAGGQGEVYKVRKPARVDSVKSSFDELLRLIVTCGNNTSGLPEARHKIQTFVAAIQNLASDPPGELGALKKFGIPETGDEAAKAVRRLEGEIKALGASDEPGILKLLEGNVEQRWMVTEYHPGGTLAHHRERYQGDALAALNAFRPIVAAVARLHQAGIVHRDIKPENIFIASDGRLVLGDFGIVFFLDASGTRLTETFERVGSPAWMPPWANTGRRLEDVKSNSDVFPLGKVLWSMISGEAMLPFWFHRKPDYNVQSLFPAAMGEMELINSILDRCIVEDESKCLKSAEELLDCVDEVLAVLQRGGRTLKEDVPRPCRVCGRGTYSMGRGSQGSKDRVLMVGDKHTVDQYGPQILITGPQSTEPLFVRMFACDVCGHIEMFHFGNGTPVAWRG